MKSSAADHPVLLPSSSGWNADARLAGEALETVWSAAAATTLDDTHYLLPPLTWQIAAEVVKGCATNDHRPGHLRVMSLPAYALDAVWSCHAALVQAANRSDDDAEHLVDLLSFYLDSVHSTDLSRLTAALERVLSVLSLDLPTARTLITHLVLTANTAPDQAAVDDVLTAWRGAGIAC